MEAPSDHEAARPALAGAVDLRGFEQLHLRVGLVVDQAIKGLSPLGVAEDKRTLNEFLSAMQLPLSLRRERLGQLLCTQDVLGERSADDMRSERLLLLLATQRLLRDAGDAHLPVSVRLQLLSFWLQIVEPPKRVLELFHRSTNTFESACETVVLDRLPAGQLSWVRSGLPRRSLLEVPLRLAVPFMRHVIGSMKGFKPVFVVHANGFRRNRFIMLEVEARRSYFRIAQVLRDQPEVHGLITVSWYHDPGLPSVSPHLAWMNGIIEEGGGVVFPGALANAQSGTFENSTARQAAAGRGDYKPREGVVLWPRHAMLAWADRQVDLADDASTARRIIESLESHIALQSQAS